jgi:head-tail adaptor
MSSASRVQHRVTFAAEVRTPDGGGGVTIAWVDQFTTYAEYMHLNGSETVIAGRITGTHTQVMRLRSTAQTRAINTLWKATDEQGRAFNLRDVTVTEDRKWLDVLATRGVAL